MQFPAKQNISWQWRCIPVAATATAILLSACSAASGGPVATGPREPISLRDEDDQCGASLVQTFVGLRANDVLRTEIAQRSAAREIRWITPDMAVTMDYRADRLNAELDADGVIRALRCG